jgi:hypothetical protein
MSTFYYAIDSKERILFDNFPSELRFIVADESRKNKLFPIELESKSVNAKLGYVSNEYGALFVLTVEKRYVNRDKLFQTHLKLCKNSIKSIIRFYEEVEKKHSTQMEDFMHNVTSLNSYSIQNLFALIPQKLLTENINKQKSTSKEIVVRNPDKTVKALLNLIKYNLAMKVEFSVFESILKPSSIPIKQEQHIRSLILNVLQIFIEEFESKNIEVSLDSCDKTLILDDDAMFVSLYYILENSVKYSCPRTKYKIQFLQESDTFKINFKMVSISIKEDEISKITSRGYRSSLAIKLNSEGHGIGMNRIIKTLEKNKANLKIIPRVNNYSKVDRGILYEGNLFCIVFPNRPNPPI